MTTPITPPLEAGLARLRQSFHTRLRSEAATLQALAAQLPSPDAHADIGRIAHRLAGSAAVFGAAQLEQPAVVVEDLVLADAAPTLLLEPLVELIGLMRAASGPENAVPAKAEPVEQAS